MNSGFDRSAIAARIRGLLEGEHRDPADAARHLHVDETGLRMSIDDLAPNPTIDVIAAVVVTYGVDPAWLLTGECDPALHRNILGGTVSAELAVARLMTPLGSRQSGGTNPITE